MSVTDSVVKVHRSATCNEEAMLDLVLLHQMLKNKIREFYHIIVS